MVTNNSINNSPDTARTAKSVMVFGAVGALSEIALTNGQLIIGNTGNAPSANTLASAGGTVAITNGAGTINLESTVGEIVQVASSSTSALVHSTSVIPLDDTIPQNTEGTEVLTCSITPTNVNHKLVIRFTGTVSSFGTAGAGTANWVTCALFQDATANALAATWGAHVTPNTSGCLENVHLQYVMTAGTTSSTTFKIRVGTNNAANLMVDVNGFNNARSLGGVSNTRLLIFEKVI